jgi:hypothetical protein
MARKKLSEKEKVQATNIRIHEPTKERLEKLGLFKDTHDSIINRLIDYYDEHSTMNIWEQRNYKKRF